LLGALLGVTHFSTRFKQQRELAVSPHPPPHPPTQTAHHQVIKKVQGYVDDINKNPDMLARGQRGPHSKCDAWAMLGGGV